MNSSFGTCQRDERALFRSAVRWLPIILWLLSSVVSAQTIPGLGSTENTAESTAESTANVADSISAETSSVSDADIQTRLEGIYSELEQYQNISVSVSNSVVTLQGSLLSNRAIEEAATLATKVVGVAGVDNQLEIETSVTERLDNSIGELATESRTIISSLPLYVLALALIIGSWYLGRWLSNKRTLLGRLAPNAFIAQLLGNIAWLLILLAGFFLALGLLDATHIITTVLSAAGIVGLAVGFAVRDTVENYIASILLSLRNPFKTRDFISVDGFEGSVARLTSRATILVSAEGNHIRIPNAVVYKAIITNYTRNPLRRYEFSVGIDSSDSILGAQQLAQTTMQQVTGVLDDPAPTIFVSELGESNTTLTIRAWVDQRQYDLTKIRGESIRQVKEAFDNNGIVMPEPIYRLVVTNSDTPATRASEVDSTRRLNEEYVHPTQELDSDNVVESTISAELELADEENLLSDDSAHE